jgi:phosphatidylglycerol:prolipoprotein diacylglycerol transferase
LLPLDVITIGIDPEFNVGPVPVAWHGITIALGLLAGGLTAVRYSREVDLELDPLWNIGIFAAVGGLVGSRLLFLAEQGGSVLGTRGFSLAGGVILGGLLIALYIWRSRLSWMYIDAVGLALPLGLAVGRVGDVINGEHFGTESSFFLAVRNSHPDALTPNPELAYHSGGLYEVILGLFIFFVMWPLRHKFRATGQVAALALGLFSIGRFAEFFFRSDSPDLVVGLNNAQWVSLAMLAVAIAGWMLAGRAQESGNFTATGVAGEKRSHD